MNQSSFLLKNMLSKTLLPFAFVCIVSLEVNAQPERFSNGKPGKYRFESHLPEKTYSLRNAMLSSTENIAFKKNVAEVAAWFQQNHPMIMHPTGYDMRTLTTWIWGDFSTVAKWEYGIPAELSFLFELLYTDGSKWSIEPPQAKLLINHVSGGHDGWYFTPESVVEDGTRYDLLKSGDVKKALEQLQSYFMVYQFKSEMAPGVHEFEAYPGGRKTIVVFNPERPPYWIPVTVKEITDAQLAYYSLFTKQELDRMVLDELKKEIAGLSSEELAASAYSGHESNFVLKVNGRGQGLQIMKFNPDYWNRSLPKQAIQFITFWSSGYTDEQKAEDMNGRGYPEYPLMFVNQVNWAGVAGLIMK